MGEIRKPMTERVQQVAALMRPEGVATPELFAALGLKTAARLSIIMTAAEAEGVAFSVRSGPGLLYFPSVEALNAFKAARVEAKRDRWRKRASDEYRKNPAQEIAERSERRRQERAANAAQRAADIANRKAMRVAEREIATQRKRLDKEAAASAKARERAEAKKLKNRLKAQTKAASALNFKAGTSTPKPAKPAWKDIPVHNPNGIEPVKLESKLRDQFAVTEAPSCFASLRPGQYLDQQPKAWVQAVAA